MAKQGMHENDRQDSNKSRGNNNPDKSVEVTTGTAKKQETYQKQAQQHKDTDKQAQAAKNDWMENTHEDPSRQDLRGDSGRNGSDSNSNQ